MTSSQVRISWFGISLIVIGLALLLNRLNILDIEFSTVFWPIIMLLGLVTVSYGFSQNRRGKIFWGTVWFLSGMFFFLRTIETLEIRGQMIVPASFLIFGIAFLMMYIQSFRDWYFLIPAFILCAVGAMFLMAEYGYLYRWEVWDAVHRYWPIALILFGLGIILRRRSQSQQKESTSTTSEPVSSTDAGVS